MTSWFKVLSSFNAIVSWDWTRLRKGTTAETQTLWAIRGQGTNSRYRYDKVMVAFYFLTLFLLVGLFGYFLFKKEKMGQEENMDLYEVFAGHPIKTPTIEIQKITWLPTFTVTFLDKADYEYAKSNGLFDKLNNRIKRRFYDTEFPVEQTVKYRWTN